jgi:hypothetical protein
MSHNKIELSENQQAPAKAQPEDFVIEKFDTKVSVTGQEENDAEAKEKLDKHDNKSPFRGSNYQSTTTN